VHGCALQSSAFFRLQRPFSTIEYKQLKYIYNILKIIPQKIEKAYAYFVVEQEEARTPKGRVDQWIKATNYEEILLKNPCSLTEFERYPAL
jgi:hypothetical protein